MFAEEAPYGVRLRLGMAGFCAIILVGAATLALRIDDFVKGWAFAMPGTTDSALAPATFPSMILWLVAALAAANLALALRARARETAQDALDGASPPTDGDDAMTTGPATPLRVAVVIGACLLYLLSLSGLGFVLASSIAIGGGALAVGYRRIPTLVLTAGILPAATWYAFRYGMKVILPEFDLW